MTGISPATVYRNEKEIGAILFNVETGESYGLNPVAKVIWEAAAAGASREEIFTALQQEFSGVPDSALNDIDEMLQMLLAKGYLT